MCGWSGSERTRRRNAIGPEISCPPKRPWYGKNNKCWQVMRVVSPSVDNSDNSFEIYLTLNLGTKYTTSSSLSSSSQDPCRTINKPATAPPSSLLGSSAINPPQHLPPPCWHHCWAWTTSSHCRSRRYIYYSSFQFIVTHYILTLVLFFYLAAASSAH